MDDWKSTIEYTIPIQSKRTVEKSNSKYGTDYKSTSEHLELLLEMITVEIDRVGTAGGWYTSDRIKVKIEIEYEPEDK